MAFVDTQDTERDGGALYYADGASYILANVFTLAWDYGTPMVLSDYAFSGYDQGPPGGGGNSIATPSAAPARGSARNAGRPSPVWSAGTTRPAAPVANWWSDGSNAIAFSRGSAAWVAINAESTPVTEDFSTGLRRHLLRRDQRGGRRRGLHGRHGHGDRGLARPR